MNSLTLLFWPTTPTNSQNSSQLSCWCFGFQNINSKLNETWGFECATGRYKEVYLWTQSFSFLMKHSKTLSNQAQGQMSAHDADKPSCYYSEGWDVVLQRNCQKILHVFKMWEELKKVCSTCCMLKTQMKT